MEFTPDYDGGGYGAVFTGTAGGQCAAFTLTGADLGINGKQRLILKVSGLNRDCRFDAGKLLKLEINRLPVSAGQWKVEVVTQFTGSGSTSLKHPRTIAGAAALTVA